MKLAPALVLVPLALAIGAPPAVADDAGVVSAYNARQATDLPPAIGEYSRAARRFRRSFSDRAARSIIRADKRLNAVLRRIGGEVAAQTASSERGADGRALALREIRGWRRANQLEMRGLRAQIAGRYTVARRYGRRANRTFNHADMLGSRAVRAFRDAGFPPLHGSVIDAKPR